jgi:hypothetical protein
LLTADLVLGEPGVLAVPHLGGEPVHSGTGGEGLVDERAAGADTFPDVLRELHWGAVHDGEQILDHQRPGRDRDDCHRSSP